MDTKTQIRLVTKQDIGRIVGKHNFNAGMNLIRCRKVRSATLEDDGWIVSMVEASKGRTHSVEIELEFSHGSKLTGVEGTCTCRPESICVHMAAALLASLEQINNSRKVWTKPLPNDVQDWLDDIPLPEEREFAARRKARRESVEASRTHVFYVIGKDENAEGKITAYKGYLRKDGKITQESKLTENFNPLNVPGYAKPVDRSLVAQLFAYDSAGNFKSWPPRELVTPLLKSVVSTGRARADTLNGATLSWGDPRPIELKWNLSESGKQSLTVHDPLGTRSSCVRFSVPFYLDADSGTIGPMESDLDLDTLDWLTRAPPMSPEAATTVTEKLQPLGNGIPKPPATRVVNRRGLVPSPAVKLFAMEIEVPRTYADWKWQWSKYSDANYDTIRIACARLELKYPGVDKTVRPEFGEDPCWLDGENLVVIERNLKHEWRLFREFRDLALEYEGETSDSDEYDVEFGEIDELHTGLNSPGFQFSASAVDQLRNRGWTVDIDDSWPVHIHHELPTFSTRIERSENDWFSLALDIEVDGRKMDVAPYLIRFIDGLHVDDSGDLRDIDAIRDIVRRLVLYAPLPDGSLVKINSEELAPIAEALLETHGLLGFHEAEVGSAVALAEMLEGCGIKWEMGRELRELGKRLRRLVNDPVIPPPDSITGSLRPYQMTGYGWLRAVADSGFGGILADDMGLGKTLQALSLLAQRHLEVGSDRPSLAVIPTSLIGNWKREASKFAPDLKLLILHGPNRKHHFAEIPNCHLAITTYPLVNRDHQELFKYKYEIALLDEAQNAKNPAAAIAKNIRQADARTRIALTGTPMENNLQELWAIFDWLIPGMLGNRKSFGDNYRRPIEKYGEQAIQRQLTSRLKPFMLRRTKEEVASELPPKTVIDDITPLSGAQRALYEGIRVAMDKRVKEAIQVRGLANSRITILDALLKLRQVCCDPALIKMQSASKVKESAKRTRLIELLDELTAEGRKVLVFSQFVQMLKLIEGDVCERGWTYSMLHGQTRDRDNQINRFQSGETSLFLISLKAGGVGLNLTAADTVIIYDPWWNPATERQAMDRAHRIGQDKPVFVHRLIAEGTVETIIQEMQVKKQSLADALFEGKGSGPLNLSESDLTALFGG